MKLTGSPARIKVVDAPEDDFSTVRAWACYPISPADLLKMQAIPESNKLMSCIERKIVAKTSTTERQHLTLEKKLKVLWYTKICRGTYQLDLSITEEGKHMATLSLLESDLLHNMQCHIEVTSDSSTPEGQKPACRLFYEMTCSVKDIPAELAHVPFLSCLLKKASERQVRRMLNKWEYVIAKMALEGLSLEAALKQLPHKVTRSPFEGHQGPASNSTRSDPSPSSCQGQPRLMDKLWGYVW